LLLPKIVVAEAAEIVIIGADFVWVAVLGGYGMSTSYGVGRLGAAAISGSRSPEIVCFSPGRVGRGGS
jgi:glycine/D-amino acid oxidase-like deaminating enzyme